MIPETAHIPIIQILIIVVLVHLQDQFRRLDLALLVHIQVIPMYASQLVLPSQVAPHLSDHPARTIIAIWAIQTRSLLGIGDHLMASGIDQKDVAIILPILVSKVGHHTIPGLLVHTVHLHRLPV